MTDTLLVFETKILSGTSHYLLHFALQYSLLDTAKPKALFHMQPLLCQMDARQMDCNQIADEGN